MAVLALLVGGGFMLQCVRKNEIEEIGGEGEEEEVDFDFDLEMDPAPIFAAVNGGNSNNSSYIPAFGVPCFNWGGLDKGHRLKGECRVGIEDTTSNRTIESESYA